MGDCPPEELCQATEQSRAAPPLYIMSLMVRLGPGALLQCTFFFLCRPWDSSRFIGGGGGGPLVCSLAAPGTAVPGLRPPFSSWPVCPPWGIPPTFFILCLWWKFLSLLPGPFEGGDRPFQSPTTLPGWREGQVPPSTADTGTELTPASPNLPALFKYWSHLGDVSITPPLAGAAAGPVSAETT